MPKNKHNKQNESPKPVSVMEKSDDSIAQSRADICYEHGVFGLDCVDCDILLSLETDEKRNAYLKKRFPEGI
jgi:hypothetical protein